MVVLDIERPGEAQAPDGPRAPASGTARPDPAVPTDRAGRRAPIHRHLARWEPLAGESLLERLRITGRPRPEAHPELVQRLRSVLESGLAQEGGPRPSSPLVVTKDRLHRMLTCEDHVPDGGFGQRVYSTALACGALVGVLFRQLVTVGALGDPMTDALDALAVDDRHADLLAWIEQLAGPQHDELRAEVERQAEGLRRRWPVLDPAWLPRTQEAMRVRMADGTVELSARVDLAIGRPARDQASVALVEVTSGAPRIERRADRHFAALLEALRSPAPPFVVATYYTRTGELDVDPVTDELLVGAARRTLAGARRLRDEERGVDLAPAPRSMCLQCSVQPDWDPAAAPVQRPEPILRPGGVSW
jgi:hypothetical protein